MEQSNNITADIPKSGALRRELWGMRLFFFILTGGSAFLSPFLGLFYREHGLSGTQIGMLATAGSLAALISAPLWGRWNDRAARPRPILQSAMILTTLCLFWLSRQTAFIGILGVTGIYALINAGSEPISNRLALTVAKKTGEAGFGSIRLWGSLGWAVMVLLSGWLIERTHTLQTAFTGAIILLVAGVLVLNLITIARAQESASEPALETVKPSRLATLRDGLYNLLHNRVMLGLAVALVFQWIVLSGVYQFQAIYLKQLGAGEQLIGVAWMVSAAVELPGMWWADRLIHRFGAGWLLAMGFLLEGLRTIPVLIWPSVAALIGAEVITGMAYSFLWIGMVVYVNEIAGNRRGTTMQALYTVTLPAVTQMLGGPLTGLAFDRLGPYWLYAIMLVGSLLAFAVLRLTIQPHRQAE